ncbi:class F sortase [Candidatus Nomurabacteria bacterium CG_4_10_14_0_2_um_filter_33_9]|uniref:Class F sortase n=1 Tax=Candidatus Nomurabacteria bacterium CG_4_10_14_0_2_um_filter_33_9 TaxID=1974728 RepID=A0A2J0MIS8_9BACT|nr:MAG: class F sortase [Candidatus Nomurabacteria bacterium CG_4_10_14_0_2_um_filter_33_9]
MQPKILSKQVLLLATLSGFILFVILLSNFFSKDSTQDSASFIENKTALSKEEQTHSDLQFRLKIPSINIDATIEYVGLAPDGTMGVPKSPVNVAWFNLGPRPGKKGSAVIAGHYGWKNNVSAVFDNLHKLRIGDEIFVEEKGIVTTFVVRKMRIYSKDEAVLDVFSSNDGKAHLNLITCTGIWNKEEKTRSDRLVVFTDKK